MDPEQPLPEKNPEFFSPEGYKRFNAVPNGIQPTRNPAYNQQDPSNLWFEVLNQQGKASYTYLDADVKENLDLYVQGQIRVVDSNLPKFRKYATELFAGAHVKDKLTGAMLMLVDQGCYEIEELVDATVGDVQFIDQVVVLCGRKFVCDLNFLDFLTSLVAQRSPEEPLFQLDTIHGKRPMGKNYMYSVFASMRVSPKFLLYWTASHMFSRIVNRMSFQQVPPEEVETEAFDELARALTTRDDVKHLVDYKLRVALLRNYQGGIAKGLAHLTASDFGVLVVRCDLTSLRQDEKEFSTWLHSEPMHDTSPAEEQQMDAQMQAEHMAANQPEPSQEPQTGPEEAQGPANEKSTPAEGAAA